MEEIKFITFTDTHISSITPESRIGDYQKHIFEKLEQIKLVGEKLKVSFFIFGGDLFNLKAPMRNPHELNGKLINIFKTFPAPIYATEGNHDLRHDSYETFNEQPLYVIYSSDALTQARNIKRTINNISFRIRSIPFEEAPNLLKIDKAKKDVDFNIIILHIYASPDGGMLYKNKLYSYEELSVLGDDIFVLGHYHSDQGIQTLNNLNKDQIFINVGSISRGVLTEEDIKRNPKIGIISVRKNEGKISYKCNTAKLKVRPAEEVFDLVTHERTKREKKEAQEFVEKLKTEILDVPKEDHISDEINKLNLEKKVFDKVNYFLNEAYMNKVSI